MSVHQFLLLQNLLSSKKRFINIPLDLYDNHFNRHTLPVIKQQVVGSSVVVTVDREQAANIIKVRNRFIKEGSRIADF